jgi:hypothetical protein
MDRRGKKSARTGAKNEGFERVLSQFRSLGKQESVCRLELELEPEGDKRDPAGCCVECVEHEVDGEVNKTPIIILTNQIRQYVSYPGILGAVRDGHR